MELNRPIQALVTDIDGCLNSTEIGRPIDLQPLLKIQQYMVKRSIDPAIPEIILCSGRALNYAESFAQMLEVKRFFVFEMGAAVAKVAGAQVIIREDIRVSSEVKSQIVEFEAQFLAQNPQFRQYHQLGKYFMFTFVFEVDSPEKDVCARAIFEYVNKHHLKVVVDVGHNFINIYNPGTNKGTGLDLILSFEQDLQCDVLAGVGDSESDWPFMQKCAFRACPSNANSNLKKKCDFVSQHPEGYGTLEILGHIIAENRKLISKK